MNVVVVAAAAAAAVAQTLPIRVSSRKLSSLTTTLPEVRPPISVSSSVNAQNLWAGVSKVRNKFANAVLLRR